ncbi:hypothetical protein [Streptomyces sp. NPDC005262]
MSYSVSGGGSTGATAASFARTPCPIRFLSTADRAPARGTEL